MEYIRQMVVTVTLNLLLSKMVRQLFLIIYEKKCFWRELVWHISGREEGGRRERSGVTMSAVMT